MTSNTLQLDLHKSIQLVPHLSNTKATYPQSVWSTLPISYFVIFNICDILLS